MGRSRRDGAMSRTGIQARPAQGFRVARCPTWNVRRRANVVVYANIGHSVFSDDGRQFYAGGGFKVVIGR
jgi:hypothetical protein